MGSFICRIKIEDQVFDARWVKTHIGRGKNAVGKVVTTTQGGTLDFRVASSNSDFLAQKMMVCEHTPFDIEVEFLEDTTTGIMKTIVMKQCFMTTFSEMFDADSRQEATTFCSVTSHTMTIGTAELVSNWTLNA